VHWNIEPQQMLYVTTSIALYGAILSTLNFIREGKKDTIRIEITVSDALIAPPGVLTKSIQVMNSSSFEVEIACIGFLLDSRSKLVFMEEIDHWYKLPDNILPKKTKSYPIRIDSIHTLLELNGISTKVRLRPFVMINGEAFSGKPFLFDPEAITKKLNAPDT
jgi:hypothetical protein